MTFDEIEEHRDATAGIEYEEDAWSLWKATLADGLDDTDYDDAYEPDDPKHPDWHSIHADIWDNRDKAAERGL